MSTDEVRDFGVRLIATFFVLWTPFFLLSVYRGHPAPASALFYSATLFLLCAFAGTLLIGPRRGARRVVVFTVLVCLFLDLQIPGFDGIVAYGGTVILAALFWVIREHLALILASVFVTVFVSSAIGPAANAYADSSVVMGSRDGETQREIATIADDASIVVHLILDGFTGLPGIPQDIHGGVALRSEISDFFQAYDFEMHPNAISEYVASMSSISTLLNYTAGSDPERYFHSKRPIIVSHNAYFEGLYARGFEINVYQTTYMDYCQESPVPLASCYSFRYDATDWLRSAQLSDYQKMNVLLGLYLNLPGMLESGWKAYTALRTVLFRVGLPLPDLMAWDGNLAPVSTMSVMSEFRETVISAPRGSAHFAHLMLPHGPYAFDDQCELLDRPLRWLSYHPLYVKGNSATGRAIRYPQYIDQVRCTLRQLRPLFDGLKAAGKWADARIIVHGDHGSRLFEVAPRSTTVERLSHNDLLDGFSTLFAIKAPHGKASIVQARQPISQLLAESMGAERKNFDATRPLSVFLESPNEGPWPAMPWPEAIPSAE